MIFTSLVGAPGKIRTPDPLVRSQVLYPAELQAHSLSILYFFFIFLKNYYVKILQFVFGENNEIKINF